MKTTLSLTKEETATILAEALAAKGAQVDPSSMEVKYAGQYEDSEFDGIEFSIETLCRDANNDESSASTPHEIKKLLTAILEKHGNDPVWDDIGHHFLEIHDSNYRLVDAIADILDPKIGDTISTLNSRAAAGEDPPVTKPESIGEVIVAFKETFHGLGTTDDGNEYQMGQTEGGYDPLIQNPKTGKTYVLHWDDIVRLAQQAGIDKP